MITGYLRCATLAVLVMLGATAGASATVVIVDADPFAPGSELTNGFGGVTLTAVGNYPATVVSADGFSPFNGRNIATTGSRVFGTSPAPSLNVPVWDEDEYNLLRADFDTATDFVQIDLIFDDNDDGFLRAYASNGALLQQVVASGDGRIGSGSSRVSISRATADIAYVTAGGVASEALWLDNLQFNELTSPVSEAASIIMFGLSLGGVIALMRRPSR